MMFLDCPAYLDPDGTGRCGLPAEVRCRFILRSTDGPLEAVMIRCPAGHWFNAPVSALTCDRRHEYGPAPDTVSTPGAARASRTGSPSPPDGNDRPAGRDVPNGRHRGRASRRNPSLNARDGGKRHPGAAVRPSRADALSLFAWHPL